MTHDPLALPKPREPFRGIAPFRLLDWRIFFERDAETQRLTNLVSLYRGVLLYGQSGSGKSSLLDAGLISHALRQGRAPERIRVYPEKGKELFVEPITLQESDSAGRSEDQPLRYLPSRFIPSMVTTGRVQISCNDFSGILRAPSDLGVPLLIFDQFEELVTLFEENPDDRERLEDARAARAEIEQLLCKLLLNDPLPLKIVFGFRDDYLARLTPLFSRIPNLMDQSVRLALPGIELLQHIVRGPFLPSQERGISAGDFGDELSEELAQKIKSGIGASQPSGVLNLSEVQTLCLALWRQPKLREELLRAADTPAVLRRIIESEAMAKLNQLRRWDRARAIAVLSNLVTKDGTRNVVSQEMLVSQTRRNPLLWIFRGDWRKFLDRLPNTGLVRRSLSAGKTYYYELASEFLIPRIQKWQQQLQRRRQAILGFICAILIGIPWYEAHRAKIATQDAKAAREKTAATKEDVDNLLAFMQYDLSETFKKLGRPDMMEEINNLIRKHFENHPPEAGDLDAMRANAVALIQHGDLLRIKGELVKVADEQHAALKIFLELGAQKPDSSDYQRDISLGYARVGDVQSAQGNLPGALESYRKGLAIREKLVQLEPDDPAWKRALSVGYDRVGDVQSAQGNLPNALENYRKGLTIREELVQLEPDNLAWQSDLSISYLGVGDVQSAQGNLPGALENYRKGLTIREELAQQEPGNPELQSDLSMSYERVGDVQSAQGNLPGALEKYREALAIREELAAEDSENVQRQQYLSIVYNEVGDVQSSQGNLPGALENYRKGLTILEHLAQQDPSDAELQRTLSISFERIGELLRARGDLSEALKRYRESLAIREKLAKQDPSNAVSQRDLSFNYNEVGDVLRDQGDFSLARESYGKAFAIRERLAKQDPSNATWQSDLSSNFEKIGNVLCDQGDLNGALKNYRDGFVIAEKLAKRDPSNAEWQNQLSSSFEKIGNVLRKQGDLSGALKNYRQGFAIAEKLAKQDLSNTEWQADLAHLYFHNGVTLAKVTPAAGPEGKAMAEKGRDILRGLKKRNALTAEQQKWLTEIEAELGGAKKRDSS
jgi:tetratricopeptide (TPR) repeat protein